MNITKIALFLAAAFGIGFNVKGQTPYDYIVPITISITATYEVDTVSGSITRSATHLEIGVNPLQLTIN
jgi:hypothetical protein